MSEYTKLLHFCRAEQIACAAASRGLAVTLSHCAVECHVFWQQLYAKTCYSPFGGDAAYVRCMLAFVRAVQQIEWHCSAHVDNDKVMFHQNNSLH